MIALLTGEALEMVHVVPGPHHHLEGRYHLVARGAEARVAKQSGIFQAELTHQSASSYQTRKSHPWLTSDNPAYTASDCPWCTASIRLPRGDNRSNRI